MPAKPCLICQQSDEIKTTILEMAKTDYYSVIVEWLQDQGIPATYDHVRYYLHKTGATTRLSTIRPVKGYTNKVQIYVGALLNHNTSTYTIKNLRLTGASWSVVTKPLHEDGLISSMSRWPRTRWHICASKDELKAWCRGQTT